ncbi:MAG TPA: DNA/RNA non-specific endonuclease [Thermoanaerobaculia bacterium]
MNARRLALAVAFCFLAASQAAFAVSNSVVISQVYGGGGASTGTPTYKTDYVELFNVSGSAVTLTGYSVQYGSSTGNFSSVFAIPSGTSIPAGGYLFLSVSSAGTAGSNFPVTPDLTTTALNMAAGSGKVALANVASALGCGATATPCSLPDARIVDLVSYGSSNDAEGGVTAGNGVALTNAQGAVRASSGCQDTDNNNADFAIVGNPVPRNSGSTKHPCGVVVNNPPVINAPANPIATVFQNAAPFSVGLTGTDDNNVFTWGATAGNGVQNVVVSSGQGTGSVAYTVTLVNNFTGTATFTATLSDGVNATVNQTVNITVNSVAVDNPPAITAPADPIATVTENAAPFNVTLSGSDDHAVYAWSATSGTGISSVTVSNANASTATFNVTLTNNFTGTATFTASLSDGVNAPVTQAVNIAVNPPAIPAGTIVISQFYGGGHNSGSTYNNDYIELFNRTNAPVSVEGWAVQMYSFGTNAWAATPLHGTIQPYSYYLIQEAQGTTATGGTTPLPTPDVVDTNDVGSTAGRIALTSTAVVLPTACSTRADILDFIGYSSSTNNATCAGRTTIPTSLSNTLAGFRTLGGCTFNNNNADWAVAPPAPRNSASPINDCTNHPQATLHVMISQVYGGGGNSGATYANDFVELYNPLDTDVPLDGWSIQYASTTGNGWAGQIQPLGGTIQAHNYFLIKLASGTTGEGLSVDGANVIGSINMAAGAGKMALVKRYGALSGNCPVGDLDLVDFIGYGTGTDCFEGGAPAPTLSNTQSAARANETDTDQNSVDFTKQTPNPHGGPGGLVPLPPNVTSTEPAPTNAPYDATVRVDFGEAVTVAPGWYSITCASSGDHSSDVTVASAFSDKSWLITPNVSFTPGETCTVTVFHDKVTNEDVTAPPDAMHPLNDFTFSFTVATGADAPYPASVHLTMGNPSNAIDDVNVPNNYLMMKPAYAESYNRGKGTPNWVSWHLDSSWYGSLARIDTFRADPKVPSDWYRVEETDFTSSGFDRGHMCPNADRDNQNRIPINQETYLMSNMVPQSPDNNQGPWANLEGYLRTLTDAGNEIYIVSGPAGVGGTGSNGGVTTTLANGHVTVPAYTWKVALVLPGQTGDDVARVTASTRVIAVIMPNVQGIRTSNSSDWMTYLTTVHAVEQLTGYNFYSNVPQVIQNAIENGVNGDNPPGTADQSVSTTEDNATTFNLTVANPTANALTYNILTSPAHGTLSGSNGSETYTPAPDFNGTDSFTYTVSDGTHTSNTSTVTITISEVNDAPSAADDAKSVNEDSSITFPASDLTTNDSAGPANESGQTLTVTSVTPTADTHGTVSLSSGQVTYTPTPLYSGNASFTYQVCDNGTTAGVTDSKCAAATVNVTVSFVNHNPVASIDAPSTGSEGSAISVSGSATDVDPGESFTFAFSVTKNGSPYASGTGTPFSFTPDDNGTYVVSEVVTDSHGGQGSASATISVSNVNPVISAVSGPASALALSSATATINVTYSDAGSADTHTAVFTWGDNTTSNASCSGGTCSASHTFSATGVYDVLVTVTDDDGGSASGDFQYVVVYNPNGGFATGSGWISQPGGKATFNFSSKYQKNVLLPQGSTSFQVGGFTFTSTASEWLVVSGNKAQLKGTGTIANMSGTFGFLVTATDGPDAFGIKVWNTSTNTVVYDSGTPQVLGGGNIQVH